MSRIKVAVLGGGIGAISSAFELTQTAEDRARFEVTVYQMGWRLGGKGASSRDLKKSARIEEHGVHVWGGYYENAFLQMRRCYEELDRAPDAPLARWTDAFKKKSHLTLQERIDGTWHNWNIQLPENDALPGEGRALPALKDYLTLLKNAARTPLSLLGANKRKYGLRRAKMIKEIVQVHLRGALRDDLLRRGLQAIDDISWTDWLARHGGSRALLTSPFVRGIHDLVFAYKGGDTECPDLSAGRVIYTFLRFAFAYKGALFWEMQAGMGEVVFAPYYEVLKKRGVGFRFFHRVDRLGLSGKSQIDRIELFEQARPIHGEYQPLIDVDGLPCWPEAPLLEQLQDGASLQGVDLEDPRISPKFGRRRTLRRGEDFDRVVLGISAGALPSICEDLIEQSDAWRRMIETTETVATFAAQLWFDRDAASMGWDAPRTILSAGPQPFNTWADMSHLIDVERPRGVRNIAYLCGPTNDEGLRKVESIADHWLGEHARWIWPGVTAAGARFNQSALVDRFFKANTHPSDRYVMSRPGSLKHRLEPAGSGFENLFLAGDWVRTSYNLGTIEAATIAGRRAAEAILGRAVNVVGEDE